MIGRPPTPQLELFLRHIEIDNLSGCWKWKGSLDKDGYGFFGSSMEWGKRAHRFSFMYFRKPLLEGLTIDHLCRNKSCVNPYHLEQVTNKENLRRAKNQVSTINSKKTHCKRGHELTGYNLIIKCGYKRTCRKCSNMMERKRRKVEVMV